MHVSGNNQVVTYYTARDWKNNNRILTERDQIGKAFDSTDTYQVKDGVILNAGGEALNTDQKICTFVLTRHGQSIANEKKLNAGSAESPLSETGIAQSVKAGKEMAQKGYRFSAVYCSPIQRTQETYHHFRTGWQSVTEDGLPPFEIANGLKERDGGKTENMPQAVYEPIKHREKNELEKFTEFTQFFNHKMPEGESAYESLNDVFQRVVPTLSTLASKNLGKTVLLIGHVGVMRSLVLGSGASLPTPFTLHYRKFDINNCGHMIIQSDGIGIRTIAVSPFKFEEKN